MQGCCEVDVIGIKNAPDHFRSGAFFCAGAGFIFVLCRCCCVCSVRRALLAAGVAFLQSLP